jgi:hypothetical protein
MESQLKSGTVESMTDHRKRRASPIRRDMVIETATKPPPPRFQIGPTGQLALEPGQQEVAKGFEAAVGTVNKDLQTLFLAQAAEITPGSTRADKANIGLAMVHGYNTSDPIETSMALQMMAVHGMAMAYAKKAMDPNLSQFAAENIELMVKLSKTFALLTESMTRHRTRGQQKMIIEHLSVQSGAQAAIGTFQGGGSGA